MKEHNRTRIWEIKLITPLHIGDGSELQLDMDYVRTKSGLDVIDLEAFLDQVSDNRGALSDFSGSTFNLFQFQKDYHISATPQYTLPYHQNPAPRNIRSFIKTGFGKPYIPGSTLKGGLRTALWTQLDRSSVPSVANYKKFEQAVRRIDGKDQHHDFLRPFQLSDSFGIEPNGVLRVEEIKFFNLMKGNKAGWKDFSTRKTKVHFNDAAGVYVETLPAGQALYVKAGIDPLFQKKSVSMAWKIPNCPAIYDFKTFANAINKHSLKIANQEASFFSQYESPKTGAKGFYKNLVSNISDIPEESEAFIVRIAWGSGWRGTTGDWIEDGPLETVRRENRLGKNGCPFCGGKVKWNSSQRKLECKNKSCGKFFSDAELWFHEVFPKTRRLTIKNGVPSIPLGWLRVAPAEKGSFHEKAKEELNFEKPSESSHIVSSEGQKHPCLPDDPKKVSKDRIENFQKRLLGVKHLTGEIALFIDAIKAEEDAAIQREMCGILLHTAKKLSKYKRALNRQKKWAKRLDELCRELDVV